MNNEIDYVLRCLRWLANAVAEDYQVNNMSNKLKLKTDKFYASIGPVIDWHELTRDDFLRLGFMCYGYADDDPYELWLIPQWLYPVIPEGMQLMDLNNQFFSFKRGCTPYEIFYGCMTYGIRIDNPSYGKTVEQLIDEIPDNWPNN